MLSQTTKCVSENLDMQHAVLRSLEFTGSHSALTATFNKMFEASNIQRVHVNLWDNSKNVAKGTRDANLPDLSYITYSLWLVVKGGLLLQRAIHAVLATGRNTVSHFKHSPLAYSKVQDVQKQLGQALQILQHVKKYLLFYSIYMFITVLCSRL